MGKIIRRAFIVLLCTALVSGCWDRKEVNDLAIIVGATIDKGIEEPVLLSLLLMVTSGGGGGQSMSTESEGNMGGQSSSQSEILVSAEGETVADALSKVQVKLSRKVFWGHNRVILFGEEVAKEGLEEHIDFFVRHPETRLRTFTFVTKGKANVLFETEPVLEQSRAEMLRELIELDIGMRVSLKELMNEFGQEGKITVMPWVEQSKLTPNLPNHGYRLNGLAVFSGGKMEAKLSQEESRGLMWIQDEIKQAMVTVRPDENEGPVSMIHLRAKTDMQAKIENNRPVVYLNIRSEDDVLQNASKLSLLKEPIVKQLEKKAEEDIAYYIDLAIQKLQKEEQTDALGFGNAVLRADPKWWKKNKNKWEEIFPTVEVRKDIKVYVRRQGMVKQPTAVPKEEVKEE
ncbi:Ger(x)C family spore germination protein [Bacillus kexueae]|uniref:Ger(x)C family spore germination protein n=1 Tax=Aeribacillus kexueae TaxID=2078952 RepID=UPI001FAF016D|nr:Ger(x)C family spore germination protein [Bacillus kexueae]